MVYATEKERATKEESGTIPDFALGRHDLTVALHFAPQLCGRDHQSRVLRKAVDDTIEGEDGSSHACPTVVLIGGTAGTGKSMLVTSTVQVHARSKVY